jgi:lysophosphatidylcholine acyltransferase/lyso-PAF acetyltransferase
MFWQFLAGLAFVSTHTSFASTMKAAFKACDTNGDGTLSRDEVETSLLKIFPELSPVTVLYSRLRASLMLSLFFVCKSIACTINLIELEWARELNNGAFRLVLQVLKLFEQLDIDRDGSISWEEFSRFLQGNPEYLAIIMAAHPALLQAPKPEDQSM